MLKIRPAQMHALTAVVSRSLLHDHALARHAAAAAALGPAGLTNAVTAVVAHCGAYGVGATDDQLRLMDLAMVFGADWQRADTRWIDEGLRDPKITDPTLRVRKVWRAALRRLAREA